MAVNLMTHQLLVTVIAPNIEHSLGVYGSGVRETNAKGSLIPEHLCHFLLLFSNDFEKGGLNEKKNYEGLINFLF